MVLVGIENTMVFVFNPWVAKPDNYMVYVQKPQG
jgi:hypothetical protein